MFSNFTYMQMTNQINAKMTYKQRENKIKKLSHNNTNDVIKSHNVIQCQIDCTIMRNSYNELYMKNQLLDQYNINENQALIKTTAFSA